VFKQKISLEIRDVYGLKKTKIIESGSTERAYTGGVECRSGGGYLQAEEAVPSG